MRGLERARATGAATSGPGSVRWVRRALGPALVVGLMSGVLSACERPVITPVELPLRAALLGEDGSVVGTQADGQAHGNPVPAGAEVTIVRWQAGAVEELASLGQASEVEVTAANRAGDIVGHFARDGVRRAFLLPHDGPLQLLTTATSPNVHVPQAIDGHRRILLTPHPGYGVNYSSTQVWQNGAAGWPFANQEFERTNEAGLAVGYSGGNPGTWAAGAWWPTAFSTRTGGASAVNERGTIAGTVLREGTNQRVAYLWRDARLVELPMLPGGEQVRISSAAGALNERDELVGGVAVAGVNRAVLWRDGGVVDLGTLGGLVSVATVVNESTQVAGISNAPGGDYHGFLWDDGQMSDLGPADEILAINDAGQVLGRGVAPGGTSVSLLWTAPAD